MRSQAKPFKRVITVLVAGIGLIGLIAALSVRAPSVTTPRAATAIEYGAQASL
jgi:threonine dehydrogenase-like Zn-dependent dehydrogenase